MSRITNILDIKMMENDAGAKTIEAYLIALLSKVWQEKESFSGKRPFGNSSWEYDIYRSLIAAAIVPGKLDEYGDIEDFDEESANALIAEAIRCMEKTS